MDLHPTSFPGKTQPIKSKHTRSKIIESKRTNAKESTVHGQKRVFGTTRNPNVPTKSVNPTAKPSLRLPKNKPKSAQSDPSSINVIEATKKSPEENRAGAKKKTVIFPEKIVEKTARNLPEGENVGLKTPARSPPLIKAGAPAMPYYSVERCSNCKFDKLETSSYWLGQIKLAESVGKHFVSVELKKYVARHEYLSAEAEWRDVSRSYGFMKEESSPVEVDLGTTKAGTSNVDGETHDQECKEVKQEFAEECVSGMTSLISEAGLNELNTFIFVLAIMQIVYCGVTMALGRAKMRSWKAWEKETQTVEYLAANDPNRFRFTTQTTFGRRHMNDCSTIPNLLWIKCFFRQFFHSVAKVDYLTLRRGFISTHLSPNSSFDFRKYIQRSLEDDFKVVVGISPLMWLLVVIFMLVDVHGWHVYLWVSFLPLTIVLVIGTKPEVIVGRMALQLKEENNVTKGAPLVQPNDNLFWFDQPQFVLTLLHYTLFMSAFELAFFVWVTLQFGIKSCYHQHVEIIVVRVVLAVLVQVLCSYITLPLYALVTQMGSNFKSAVLEEETVDAIKQWHANVKEKRKKQQPNYIQSPQHNSSTTCNNSKTNSPDISSSHHRAPTLAQFESRGWSEITEEHHQEPTQ